MANKTNELSHSKWVCKYHIVFTPKYRRKIIYNKYREDLIEIFKRLCSYKGVEIIEGHMMPDFTRQHGHISEQPNRRLQNRISGSVIVGRVPTYY